MIVIDIKKCRACGCCIRSCPNGALRLGMSSAEADSEKCVTCLLCAAACPFDAITAPTGC